MSMESPGWANQAGTYSAEQTRRAVFSAYARTSANSPGIIAGGLLSTADLQLSAPGSGMSVNVSTGEAIVGGTEGGAQGGYYARCSSTTNLTISAANPSNPRIDTVCLTIADSAYTEPSGVSGDAATLQVVTGTPTAGATLSNLNGAGGLPASSLLLGYVLVPAGASNIVSGDISNRATQALGQIQPLYPHGYEWSYAQITSPVTITSTTESSPTTIISPGSFTPDGQPMMVEFFCPYVTVPSTVGQGVAIALYEGATEIGRLAYSVCTNASQTAMQSIVGRLRFTPTSAPHTYTVGAYAGGAVTPGIGAGTGSGASFPPAYIRFTKV